MLVTSGDFDVWILTGAAPRRMYRRPLHLMRTRHSFPAQSATAELRGVGRSGRSSPPHAATAVRPAAATSVATDRVSAWRTATSVSRAAVVGVLHADCEPRPRAAPVTAVA